MDKLNEEKLSHLNDLLNLAKADGNVSLNEVNFINSVADRLGVSREELKDLQNRTDSVTFTPPKDIYQLMIQFHRLMVLMGIDRVISPEEKEFCFELGSKMKLKKNVISEIIDKAIDAPRHVISLDDIENIFYRHYKEDN